MKINRVRLTDFLVFKGKQPLDISFNDGINVIIGKNTTGKTTLLKCIYAACEHSNTNNDSSKTKKFRHYFSPTLQHSDSDNGAIQVFSGEHELHFNAWHGKGMAADKYLEWLNIGIKAIFIPSAEMLSHSKGLVAMSNKYGVPFDHTQIDILVNAQLWETKEISDRNAKILALLGDAIDGEVIYENDMFYVIKNNGLKIEYALEAEGLKRLGLLWKLTRNGLLEPGTILLWDEPESSVHPEHMSLVADVLLMLARDGVQVIISSHEYAIAKYLELRKNDESEVLFISMYKENDIIKAATANSYSSLQNNAMEEAEEELYQEVVKKVAEDNGWQT